MDAVIEIYVDGSWQRAATFDARMPTQGHASPSALDYDLDYAERYFDARGAAALSARYPVTLEPYRSDRWPAFVLDILPTGAGRDALLDRLGLHPNGIHLDWRCLREGAGAPVGNLRVAEAAAALPSPSEGPGFELAEVVDRAAPFAEHALRYGAPAGGSSGVQGEAPKYLLTQNHEGRWFADSAIPDAAAQSHWILKYPRGPQQRDLDLIRHEAAYMEIAQALGVHCHEPRPRFVDRALLIRRFDRETIDGSLHRHGVESLASLAGLDSLGANTSMEALAAALVTHSTDPSADLCELLRRDVLDVAFGNTDNHPRNQAMLKRGNSERRLSPRFDFAPMFVDYAGIPRRCRWTDCEEASIPRWEAVCQRLEAELPAASGGLREMLRTLATPLGDMTDALPDYGLDAMLIERLKPRIAQVAGDLQAVAP